MIEVANKTRSQINISLVRKIAIKFLKKYKLDEQDVSIVFIGDQRMHELNKKYRKIDKVTDVLSFRDQDSLAPESGFLGEVIIDFQQIKRQAKNSKHSIKNELIYILVHGLLHLVGYDDKTERQANNMDKLTDRFIKQI